MCRRQYDTNGQQVNPATRDAQQDGSQKVQSIGREHQRIHDGHHYQIANYQLGMGNNDTVLISLTTPADLEIHLTESYFAINGGTLEIYEGATVTGGIAIDPPNSNRNSLNQTSAVVLLGPTIVAQGDRRFGWLMGGGREAGDAVRHHEVELAKSTTYLLVATCTAGSNGLSWDLNFYEED